MLLKYILGFQNVIMFSFVTWCAPSLSCRHYWCIIHFFFSLQLKDWMTYPMHQNSKKLLYTRGYKLCTKIRSCNKCHAKIITADSGKKILQCTECKLSQLKSKCKRKILASAKTKTKKLFHFQHFSLSAKNRIQIPTRNYFLLKPQQFLMKKKTVATVEKL